MSKTSAKLEAQNFCIVEDLSPMQWFFAKNCRWELFTWYPK